MTTILGVGPALEARMILMCLFCVAGAVCMMCFAWGVDRAKRDLESRIWEVRSWCSSDFPIVGDVADFLLQKIAAPDYSLFRNQLRGAYPPGQVETLTLQLEKARALNLRWNREASRNGGTCGSEFIDDPEAVFARIREILHAGQDAHKRAALAEIRAMKATLACNAACDERDGLAEAWMPVWGRVAKPKRNLMGKVVSVHSQDVFIQASEIERIEAALANPATSLAAALAAKRREGEIAAYERVGCTCGREFESGQPHASWCPVAKAERLKVASK